MAGAVFGFISIGNGTFDILRKLDTMEGRIVDNANFFHLQALEAVTDEALYNQLLDKARSKRIIR